MADPDSGSHNWHNHWSDRMASADQYVVFGESQVGKTMFIDKVNTYRSHGIIGKRSGPHITQGNCAFRHDPHGPDFKFTDLSSTTLRTADPTFSPSYFTDALSQALGVVLIYDVTSRESFERITNGAYMYLCMLQTASGQVRKCECVLVGNKVDLVWDEKKEREIDAEEAREWAETQGMEWYEVSAKEGLGVRGVVEGLVGAVEKRKLREARDGKNHAPSKGKEKMSIVQRIKSAFKSRDPHTDK